MAAPLTRIVAEVSVNYKNGEPIEGRLISERFERVIATNAYRGFNLDSWQLNRLQFFVNAADGERDNWCNETIVAVFVQSGKKKT